MIRQFIPKNVRNPFAIWKWFCRDIRLKRSRKLLTNRDFSIICNNCLGGMVVHDYYQPQLSPTVNLYMLPDDYILFISNFYENLKADVIEIESHKSYPIGKVNDSVIHFLHYRSFEEAKQAWSKRANRINKKNLLFIFVERDGCKEEHLLKFDALPFPNKLALVHKPYHNVKCAVVMPGFESSVDVGKITDWKGICGMREYDAIDWVAILNSMK